MRLKITKYFHGFILSGFIFSGCAITNHPLNQDEYRFIHFRTISNRIPVILVSLNNRDAWFIIDTGASFTLLNDAEEKNFGFYVKQNANTEVKKISGVSGRLALRETIWCRLQLGTLDIRNFTWRAGDISDLVSGIEAAENIRITGIIGSDLLLKYRINVNFDSQTLSYRVRKNSAISRD